MNLLFVRPKWSFGLGSGGSRELNVQPMIHGYTSVGENLLEYDVKDDAQYRLGFAVVI